MPVNPGDLFTRLEKVKKAIRALPTQAGAVAENFFRDNFSKQGWQGDVALEPWEKRKNNVDPGRAILVGKGSGHLRKGIQKRVNGFMVQVKVVGRGAKYADAHNFGETIKVRVTGKMKRWAWAMYYNLIGRWEAHSEGKKKSHISGGKSKLLYKQAMLYKGIALKKEGTVMKIQMPKRQFIGNSKQLDKRLNDLFEKKIDEAANR